MPKRLREIDESTTQHTRRQRPRIKLENTPPVHSIHDLVDISKTDKFYKNIDTVMLWRIAPYLEELENMIGMKDLKESVFYQVIYYLQNMHTRNQNEEYLHTIISGPPGTGKTTVARIIGNIYQALGILSPTGSFRVAYRDDFIAGYLGQTAIKTRKLLKSCIGGILFIDEVYSLAPRRNDRDSFSKEALDTLTAFLSEHKNDFCCIAAGYEEDINDCFFAMNRGLRRRFPWVHKIDVYSSEELTFIFTKMLTLVGWEIGMDEKEITKLIAVNKDLFKHAGGSVEIFISKAKMVHAKRVFSLRKEHKFVLTMDDLQEGIKLLEKHQGVKKDETPLGMYM
jgi:SpoVK/Ycf46/Vps4 family AAA+-type ATPase